MRPNSFDPANPRILFFGTTGETSLQVLTGLLSARIPICGVVVWMETPGASAVTRLLPDTRRSPLPLIQPFVRQSIIELAWSAGMPVMATQRLKAPELRAQLAELQPDLACVACFPRRIPQQLLALPAHGFLNVHPALLPAHRGPAPLFWTFHSGEQQTGVTIHWMDAGFDTGPIALQARIELLEGSSYQEADQQLWELGTALLIEALGAFRSGTLARHTQPTVATYEPWPRAEHFMISTQWSAQRAFNFMRGTAYWGQPFRLRLPDQQLELTDALGYDPEEILDQPYGAHNNELWVQFAPGVLRAHGRIH